MSYLSKIKNGAIQGWVTHKILPSVTGAQAILESGSGTSLLAKAPYNNQFGIKAGTDWEGRRTPPLLTREWVEGRWAEVYEEFRAYDSINESLIDHASFFTNTPWRTENYKAVVNEKDYIRACWALQNAPAPYATDPGYATKLIRVIESNQLQEWDKAVLSGGTGQGNVIPKPSNVITSVSKTVGGVLTSTARQYVKSSSVSVIGDSLGVGTRTPLSELIPLANFNVLGSRQLSGGVSPDGLNTLQSMKTSGALKDTVIIILGTNAGVTRDQIAQAMNIIGDRKVLLVDTASEVAHRDKVAHEYISASKSYTNVFHVDWNSHAQPMMADYYSKDGANSEYIHMTHVGYKKHAEYIAEAVYEVQTGDFDVRKASNVLSDFHDIKDIELTQDGVIKYSIFNEQGTEVEVVEQTDILGLESPKGDSAVYNPSAQEQWGMNDGLIKSQWIESLYENSSEKDARTLLMEASKELLERAEPSAQYRVSLMDIPDTLSIGDTGIYIDHEFNPPLYIQARVLELTTSFTNPSNNSVVIGNVIELYPQDNSELEALRNELINSRAEIKRELLGSEPIFAEVISSNGNVLGDRYQETTLTAGLKQGVRDIVIGNERVTWQRVSTDATADDTYNKMLESDAKSTLTVFSKDVIGGHSRFVARFYNDADQLIQQAEIVIKKADTALWTDTDTAPPYAKDGATWVDESGKHWILKDGEWEERVDQALVTAITNELEKAQDKVKEVEGFADELDKKVLDYQKRVGSDGSPQFNKNRADKQNAISRGEAIPLNHNGYGFVAGKQMTLSFKAMCLPITQSDLTLNFTADDLIPPIAPRTKSNMVLNFVAPEGTIPPEPVESNFDNARVVNLADFGGSSSNADNFTAFKNAVNASATEPLVIEIDAGVYNLEGGTNDRIQMEPWESAKSKGVRLVGKGNVVIRHKNNRTVNRHEYYFMQLVMSEDSLGFEVKNITLDGSRNPQEELFYTQSESNPVPNIPLTRGFSTHGAHNVQYKNVTFKSMYGGYAIQMSEYRDVTIQDVAFDKVGGNDIQESFGMAIYLGGHSGDAVINIDNAHAQGMVTDKELKLSWIGVVLENGSIQSSNPSVWMRDKNTTVNITNSSFMDYHSTFHVESIAGNVYWNVDNVDARGSNYQIVAGVYGEYKESTNNLRFDMLPYGRLWGIVKGLYYSEAQEAEDNWNGHNAMNMHNSVIDFIKAAGFNDPPQAVAYGSNVTGRLHHTQLNNVPHKLVTNGSALLYNSEVNLAQGSQETRQTLMNGNFSDASKQRVQLNNTNVNAYGSHKQVQFGDKPAFVKNTGFVAPFIELPISPPI